MLEADLILTGVNSTENLITDLIGDGQNKELKIMTLILRKAGKKKSISRQIGSGKLMGIGQVGKSVDFDSMIRALRPRRFEPYIPSHFLKEEI